MKQFYKFEGEVYDILDLKTIGDKGFRIRPVILKTVTGGWTDHVQFDCVYDAADQTESLNKGDLIEVEFTIGGRRWENHSKEVKYFNKLEVKKITVIEKSDVNSEAYNNADVPF